LILFGAAEAFFTDFGAKGDFNNNNNNYILDIAPFNIKMIKSAYFSP